MRLFVALELPEATRAALRDLMARLEPLARGARWVRAEGMHLTVKFIGEFPEEKLPALREALSRVRSAEPARMKFRGLGCFPNDRRPRVLWAGVEASASLAALAAEVDAALAPLGVARESRAYVPHLTLARFREPSPQPRLQNELAKSKAWEFGEAVASEFYLFESKLSPRGAEYRKLETFSFVRS
jgi:2'-5' RNA ligase